MKNYTVHTTNEQYYKFKGELDYINETVMIYKLLDGSTITFYIQHIVCVEASK